MPLSRSNANERGRSGSQTRAWKSSQPKSSMASQTRETPDSVPVTAIANRGLPSSRSFSSFCRTKSVSFCDNEPPVESRKVQRRAGAEDIGGERERVGEIGDDAAPVVDRGGIDRARQPAGAEMERAGFANAGEAERIDHAAVGNRHASIRAPARIADRE